MVQRRYTNVPNCTLNARIGKLGQCRLRNQGVRAKFEGFDVFVTDMNAIQGSEVTSSILIGKWTAKICFGERPHSGQLRPRLGSVAQRMLTRTLRNLESTCLIARRVTQSKAITVQCSLTKLGKTIIASLRGMCRWAKRFRKDVSADMRLWEVETR
jgi:DNA-binding HxlR family transcriptional regulator